MTAGVVEPNALLELCTLVGAANELILAGLVPPKEKAGVAPVEAEPVSPKLKPADEVGFSASFASGFDALNEKAPVDASLDEPLLPNAKGCAGAPTEKGEADLDLVSPCRAV